MTLYDVLALVIVLGSAAAGWIRGGAREIVTLVSFTLAALLSLLVLPFTGPFARHLIQPGWIGTVAAVLVVFVVAHIGIRAFGGWLSKKLQDAKTLGSIDRVGGLGFGIARALILLGVFHLIFAAVTPPERLPHWFRNAKVFPVSAAAAKLIQAVLPKGAKLADHFAPVVEASVRRGASDQTVAPPKSSRAYSARERARMDALVEKSR
jgi:membrane protein required for colicin V production